MHKILSLPAIITLLLTALPSLAQQMHQYELHVGEFSNLQVIDNVNVVWTASRDSAGFVRFIGPERYADAFMLSNNGKGTLKICVATDEVNQPDLPTLYIYSSFLTEVSSSSLLPVKIYNVPPAAKIKFKLIGNGSIEAEALEATEISASITTGNGSITLQGECKQANFSMYGTGQIRADQLQSQEVKCTIMGTGAIFTWPITALSTKGIGSTKIYYRGNPEEIKKHGGGKLLQLEPNSIPLSRNNENQLTPSTTESYEIEEAQPSEEEEEYEEEETPLYVPQRRN